MIIMDDLKNDKDSELEFSFGFITKLENEAKYVQTREDYNKLLRYYTMDVLGDMAEYSEFKLTSDSRRLLFWELQKRSFKFVSIQYSTIAIVPDIETENDMKSRCDMILSHIENEMELCKSFLNAVKEFEQIGASEAEEDILFVKDIDKIVLLYELGIVEFLQGKIGTSEPGRINKWIRQFTGMTKDSIKKAMQRIELERGGVSKESDGDRYAEHFRRARTYIGTVKPTNEVLSKKGK